jgi:hypothetical protein
MDSSNDVKGALVCSNPRCLDKLNHVRSKIKKLESITQIKERPGRYTVNLMSIPVFDPKKKLKSPWSDSDMEELIECINLKSPEMLVELLKSKYSFNEDELKKVKYMAFAVVNELNNKLY